MSLSGIIGDSKEIQEISDLVHCVAVTDSSVMISGPTGTGKELIAQNIHRLSGRDPFVAVNCAAISEGLIESILFGHERGSFTGALNMQIGKFEQADGGTLFLDEIGSMPINLQAKLLRAIQERQIERVGGRQPISVDVRLICASNENLVELIENGSLRADLYYRISVIPIRLPALAERREDIPLLAYHFLEKYDDRFGRHIREFTDGALEALVRYDWPGNVRQLENVIHRIVVTCDSGIVKQDDLPDEIFSAREVQSISRKNLKIKKTEVVTFKDAMHGFAKEYISKVLIECNWNQSEACRRLKISRNAMRYRMDSLGIEDVFSSCKEFGDE